MKLKDWLAQSGIPKVKFAVKMEVCRDTIYRWLNGTVPTKYAAKRLKRITKGKVTLKDWDDKKM